MSQVVADRKERLRRWRLALGEESTELSEKDQRLSSALSALYDISLQGKGRGGLGASAPRVSRWLGDIREFFPDTGRAGDPEGRI